MNNHAHILFLVVVKICLAALPAAAATDLTETMKQSLVYLEISNSRYDQYQPWRQSPISKEGGFACAVGPYEILTTAENVMYAALVQARCHWQNEYIPATIKVVDYEYNLCLLELDKNAMDKPLKPLRFEETFPKNSQLDTYWLSSGGHLTAARSTLDRAEMNYSDISFVKNLFYLATNTSRPFGDGEVCCRDEDVIGIAAWGSGSDSGIIPAETINRFLNQAHKETYKGFGGIGFEVFDLLDPTMRSYLKMPDSLKYGVYVSSVYTLGTGSQELKSGDVILSIDGHDLNPYGRYLHEEYDRVSFEHLILQKMDGEMIPFEIWRDGKKLTLDVAARNVKADEMLVPYYLYNQQPEFIVVGGFVFQKLTRDFLEMWGEGWSGKVPPHLFQYYRNKAFKPTAQRQDIVVLNYVLPSEMNLGYQQLSRLVVSSLNRKKISSFKEFVGILNSDNVSDYFVVEFEMDTPKVIIPRNQLNQEYFNISQIYGISKMSHIQD